MSTPAIVTVCVIGMIVMLLVLMVLGMCLASSNADDALGIGEGFPVAGTGAAADAAPQSVASGVSLPTPDARRLHPSNPDPEFWQAPDSDDRPFFEHLAEQLRKDGEQ